MELEAILPQVESFAKVCSPFPIHSVGGSLWDCGFIDADLLLPSMATWTMDQATNENLLKLLTLRSIALQGISIRWPMVQQERILPRVFSLCHMPKANLWLDQQFPGFREFEKNVLSELIRSLPEKERFHDLYPFWLSSIDCRNEGILAASLVRFESYKLNSKRHDIPPIFLHATLPVPPRHLDWKPVADETFSSELEKRSGSNKLRKRREEMNPKELKKEGPINPVMHSFEKLETLEDYQGGRRIEDGEDELEAHSNAIDELELSSITKDGKASSTYSQDRIFSGKIGSEGSDAFQKLGVFYPEWNYQGKKYLKNHCTIYESNGIVPENWTRKPLGFAEQKIKNWRRRVESIVHDPAWIYGQLDGTEIDLDRVISRQSQPDKDVQKIFMSKRKTDMNLAISFLVDASLSTDSYLEGTKIMDLIRQSVGLCGELFEPILKSVAVSCASSATRSCIQYTRLKDFHEDWSLFFPRADSMEPSGYTRLGPAIRHSIFKMSKVFARNKVMILITDGKPTDIDPYEGKYGQEDVRKAIREAIAAGVQVKTVAISDLGMSDLKYTFGDVWRIQRPDDFVEHLIRVLKELTAR